jgi:uncharacterized ferritin-like protein (DUF455 family)
LADDPRRILFGATLDDKLAPLSELDAGPPIEVPAAPGRPPFLALGRGKERFEFPTARELETEAGRGRALHFFANHELLALELMALMLLRFPDADPKLRRQLATTIADEQRHLSMYLGRMRALGVELGDVRVSDAFWRAMKDVPSPAAFVAAMSLTFEQANLDFSKHYAERCRAIGDVETASILDAVYEDEIRHVRAGVRWMEAFAGGGEPLFDVYAKHLRPPLTPARAKGPVFDEEGRRRAGLDGAFIRSLSAFSSSKGRTPRLFVFDAACEDSLAHGGAYTPPKEVLELEADLAPLLGFLGSSDDEVLVPAEPSIAFRARLAAAGFRLPRFVTKDRIEPGRTIVAWGTGPRIRALAGVSEDDRTGLFSKAFGAELLAGVRRLPEVSPLCGPAWTIGVVRHGDREVVARAAELFALGVRRVVAKALYGSSGRHRVFLDADRPLDPPAAGWLRDRAVIVEPWLDRVRDLSIVASARDKPRVLELLTDARGRYRGHRFGDPLAGLDLEDLFRRADLFGAIRAVTRHVRDRVPFPRFGIDALLYRLDGRTYLQPIVEVNPRLTMGHVAAALAEHVAPRTSARWLHLDAKAIDRAALDGEELTLAKGKITGGRIATNDPSTAIHVVTVLEVGRQPPPPTGGSRPRG